MAFYSRHKYTLLGLYCAINMGWIGRMQKRIEMESVPVVDITLHYVHYGTDKKKIGFIVPFY